MDILKKGQTVISQKMNNNMIQYSVFAGIVFIIIAHPQTFKLVYSVIKVHNKNILLFVHAIVVSLIMYFGSLYLFIPAKKILLEGIENGAERGEAKGVVKGIEVMDGLASSTIQDAMNCLRKTKDIPNDEHPNSEHEHPNSEHPNGEPNGL